MKILLLDKFIVSVFPVNDGVLDSEVGVKVVVHLGKVLEFVRETVGQNTNQVGISIVHDSFYIAGVCDYFYIVAEFNDFAQIHLCVCLCLSSLVGLD